MQCCCPSLRARLARERARAIQLSCYIELALALIMIRMSVVIVVVVTYSKYVPERYTVALEQSRGGLISVEAC